MQLYGSHTSPYVRHCRLVLLLNNEAYTLEDTDLTQSAALSPSKKIPYLIDGSLTLSDSSAIVRYLREKRSQAFLANLADFDTYCLTSTLLDSAINVFYLEKEGVTVNQASYLLRQQTRVIDGLNYLETHCPTTIDWSNDMHCRLVIFLAWGLFRQRFNIDQQPRLQSLLAEANSNSHFRNTAPA